MQCYILTPSIKSVSQLAAGICLALGLTGGIDKKISFYNGNQEWSIGCTFVQSMKPMGQMTYNINYINIKFTLTFKSFTGNQFNAQILICTYSDLSNKGIGAE